MSRRLRTALLIIGSLAVIVGVVSVLGGLAWYKYRSITAAASQPPPPEMPEVVTIAPSTEMHFQPNVTAIGTVLAPRSVTLRNEIAGQVTKVTVVAGEKVKDQQLLLELDHSVEDASLLAATARQRVAKSMLARTRRVANENASSANELELAEAEMAQADAEVARLRAIIAKKQLAAPFVAKAGLLNTYVGQYLSEGTEITTLQGIDDYMYVDFMMPQSVADAVEIGQTVQLLTSSVSTDETLDAELIALDAIADRSTRNLMGRAKLSNPPPQLQPNDAVKVQINYGAMRHAIAVPAEAVRRSPSGAFVYVATPDEQGALRARTRPVVPGQTIGDSVMIYQGLSANEHVVVDGSFKLHEGALVIQLGSSQQDEPM